jgi:hypothetical protein
MWVFPIFEVSPFISLKFLHQHQPDGEQEKENLVKDRQTDNQTNRQTETDKQINRQTDKQTNRLTD